MALLTMLRHLRRAQIVPFYASLEFGAGNLPEQVRALGIPVAQFAPGRFRNLPASIRCVAALARLVREQQIDLVFSNSGHPLLFARPASLLAGRPCVWWVHGYFPEDPMKGHWIALGERLLHADALFANSQHTAGALRRVFPEHPCIRVVHYGTDTNLYAPSPAEGQAARAEARIPVCELVIGVFGRLHPFKGQDIFLRAAAKLKQRGTRARFLLVGGTPFDLAKGYPEHLRSLAGQMGLNGEVAFLGQRADAQRWMNACDIVVHSSVEPEPWGLVVSEGMACGRAVVAAAAGGPLEMIAHGKNGWLVQPNDPDELAQAWHFLLQHPGKRHELGEAARKYAVENFAAQRAADIFSQALREVWRKHGAHQR